MSLFDQGTASECSAALSSLPPRVPDVGSISERFFFSLVSGFVLASYTGDADVEGPERCSFPTCYKRRSKNVKWKEESSGHNHESCLLS